MVAFKEAIFTKRLITFNESIVSAGQNKNKSVPHAVLWYEAISGRKMEDIVSAYYALFLENRDVEEVTSWLDNCLAQNKNWTFFSFLVYLIICNDVAMKLITIKYFEPGHTFMSSNSFHHQVELSMKHKGKVYEFPDFKQTVQSANSGKVKLIEMNAYNFFQWDDFSSKYKLQKMKPTVYLKDIMMVQVK